MSHYKESELIGNVEVAARSLAEADKLVNQLWESGTLRLSEERIRALSLNLIVVPPKGKAEPHTHSDFESAVYVISGRAIHHWGDRLQHSMETNAGDFLFIAPGVPHYPENPYDEPVVAVVARNDPEEQEHVIPFKR